MPDLPAWKRFGYSSLEAFISSKAGASPPDVAGPGAHVEDAQNFAARGSGASGWPFSADAPTTPPDDEALEVPDEH